MGELVATIAAELVSTIFNIFSGDKLNGHWEMENVTDVNGTSVTSSTDSNITEVITSTTDSNITEAISTDSNITEVISTTDLNITEAISTDSNITEAISTDSNITEAISTDSNITEAAFQILNTLSSFC
jgi:hypothetical protein